MVPSRQYSPQRKAMAPPENTALANAIANFAQQCNVRSSQIEDIYPCTPLQHGMFVLSAASEGAYIAQHVFKLQDSIDTELMKNACNMVIQRNAIFRTRIVAVETRALQVVLKDWLPEWTEFVDLPTYLTTDKQIAMEYGDPLLRLGISKTHLVWTAHHSIYDGYSIDLMLEDIAAAYTQRALPVRPPYRNFVKYLQQQHEKAKSKSFWESVLSAKEVPPFPTVHPPYQPRPNETIKHYSQSVMTVSSEVTTATLVQAAWALVLSSHLNSSTVSFGTTMSGRNSDIIGIESIMGPTIATVPVCLEIDYGQSAVQYLRAMQKLLTEMIPHLHLGLQNIKEIGPAAAEACAFQNLLVVHPAQQDNIQPTYRKLFVGTEEKIEADFLDYSLTVQCSLGNNGILKAAASFDSTVIDAPRVQRLLFQLEHVVRQLGSSDTRRKLNEIDLLSPSDINQIQAWNGNPPKPFGLPLDMINKHFLDQPEAIAICAGDGEITYSKLDALSSQLASYLVSEHGIGPESIVPVCYERSLWMVVAVIATMKTGAAFTLLDPSYPVQRLEKIIELTDAKVVLVSRACRGMFNGALTKFVEFKETVLESSNSVDSASTSTTIGSPLCIKEPSIDNAMYVVFTSGSTGQPKGVVITFGSYFAGAMAHIPVYDLGPQSRVLAFASPAFDLCLQEIVSTLMAGGCLCVPTEDDRFGDIASVIQSMNVNMASFTPSFARQISPDSVPSLKKMIFVGEALPKDQRDTWADKLWLMNSYGPSECSVISTINPRVTKSTYPTNIGPLLTGSAWIVHPDDESRLVPIGATGELLIEGPLLGRGYLNDPAKTAASFIETSLLGVDSGNGTRRLYKTGDLVRYDPTDGSIIYEGRKDMQVKIRGQRVEIGEIEHHLGKTFPKASGAAVELLKHANNTVAELVAFIFCDGMWDEASEHKPHQLLPLLADSNINNMADIKSHLANVLPRHMVPSRFYLVPKRPMQPAGKLDRKKLRQELLEPTGYHFELERSDIEISLLSQDSEIALRLSEKIVKLVTVKDTDGAIELSGRDLTLSTLGLDSIQLISLLTYIRKEYDVKLSIAILYNNNLTISGLAKIIDDYQSDVVPQHSEQTIDLSKQIQDLYDNFLAAPLIQNELASKTIFLTGATGYLGSQILRQLLTDTLIKKVIVHVRAATSEEALDRVVHAASLGKWWSAAYLSRIECWPGDLRAHNLGLLPNQWSQLTGNCYPGEQINHIIHNGATVQWQAPYSALKAANVDSTLALLSAVRQWPSPGSFTYVSGGLKRTPDMDLDSFAASLQASNGYNQTKFVSEQLTARFATGNPKHNVSIVRPGLIIGTEVEGIPNTDDFLWRLVQVCVSIGGYPAEKQDYWLSVTSVEEVATSIIDSTLSPGQQTSKVWDIDTGLVVGEFWAIVGEELGGRLKPMNGKEWIIAVKSFLENAGENHAFQPLMAMFQEPTFSLGSPASVSAKSDPSTFPALRKNLRTLLSTGYLWVEEQSKDSRFPRGLVPESGTLFSRSSMMKAGHGLLTKVVG